MTLSLLLLLFCHVVQVLANTYSVDVYTGSHVMAGTYAAVYCEVFGLNGYAWWHLPGSYDVDGVDWSSQYTDSDIGEIYEIHPFNDNTGFDPGWYLEYIYIWDHTREIGFYYYCNCWIHGDDEGYLLSSVPQVCYGIPNCPPGYKLCGASIYESHCILCNDPYYSVDWAGCLDCECQHTCWLTTTCRNGQKSEPLCRTMPVASGVTKSAFSRCYYCCCNSACKCTAIAECADRYCTNYYDQKCRSCNYDYVLYKPSWDSTQCQLICSYWNHHCWPGTCSDYYTTSCQCSGGFELVSTGSNTTCQLNQDNLPTLETCLTNAEGPNLELRRSESTGPTTECKYQGDFYGNFVPVAFNIEVLAFFRVDTSGFPGAPYYIHSYGFGITDVFVLMKKLHVSGHEEELVHAKILDDASSSTNAVETYHHEGRIEVPSVTLNNGEKVCLWYYAYGGGYVHLQNEHYQFYSTVPYNKRAAFHPICYRYDDAPPQHCHETRTCIDEPLKLPSRITQDPNMEVVFDGWEDAIPDGGSVDVASGIESYQVTVHEVSGSGDTLQVDLGNVFSMKVDNNVDRIQLNLSLGLPRLFCVLLEVKDIANNVRQARRFFLYDNSTFITTRSDRDFYVSSANMDTNYMWQNNHNDVCLDWTDHFYNEFYLHNNLLAPIEPDHHGLINGYYEQTEGILPVSGTTNVYGIVQFKFSFSSNNSTYSAEDQVPNFANQTYCSDLNVNDGDVLALKVRAIDIVGNSMFEEITVNIDASTPHITDMGLVKDGHTRLFVHDQTDLSKMDLHFKAYDPHSGIKTVEWIFAVSNNTEIVDTGAIGVITLDSANCSAPSCYCPMISEECEQLDYSVPLHSLVNINKHIGNHNRNYYITIKVTNWAELTTTESVTILVDESPPETGVILEGPEDYPDIDYTSDETFLVHWHGFIDHESGISLYRIGLSHHCLSKSEVFHMHDNSTDSLFLELLYPENTVRIETNFTGKRYTSIIALNNAMEPSEVVCTDGISVDVTPPDIMSISIDNARWVESIYCIQNTSWLLLPELTKIKLGSTNSCKANCNVTMFSSLVEGLPLSTDSGRTIAVHNGTVILDNILQDENISVSTDSLCESLPAYDSSKIIYLPNDQLTLRWNVMDEISQIQDVYVGIGTTHLEEAAPDIIDYMPTNNKNLFHIHHSGIGTDKVFYIFLKAVNKAGLYTVIPIGPLLIDQTPPRFDLIPDVIIVDDELVVGWENDTFYDEEQKSQVNKILFQIGHDNQSITPIMEWRQHVLNECPTFTGGCFKYPLPVLQKQDTDLGLMFYVTMHVYNIAGHFITVQSKEFTLPSVYPPGHAIVKDIDPQDGFDTTVNIHRTIDVDAHFTNNTICIIWAGFWHHEDVTFEIGVGSLQGFDDLYSFIPINRTFVQCITSPNIPNGKRIFVSIQATSSGGSTLSSSDGVIIYDPIAVMDDLKIFDGPDCFKYSNTVPTTSSHSGDMLTFERPLHIGKVYTLQTYNISLHDAYLDPYSLGIHVKEILTDSNRTDIIFQAFVEIVTLPLAAASNISKHNARVELFACEQQLSEIKSDTILDAHWQGLSDYFTYETAVIILRCSDISDESCHEYKTPLSTTTGKSVSIIDLHLQVDTKYYVGVRACLNSHCLKAKLSPGITVSTDGNIITIKTSELTSTSSCPSILLEWEKLSTISVSFYQWSVMALIGQTTSISMVQQWQTVQTSLEAYMQIQECVDLPFHTYKQLTACVRAVTASGKMIQTCRVCESTDQNVYDLTVYEFDASSAAWPSIKEMMQSRYLGDALVQMHNEEIDFGSPDTHVVGALPSGTGRNITWFLTTIRTIPGTCAETPECVASKTTSDGYVYFDEGIQANTIYYTCASAEETQIIKEPFSEQLPAVHVCSNGFVIDDTPPSGGEVHVVNFNGFLNNLHEIDIHWNGFDDNIDVDLLGYKNKINTYIVEIGSGAGDAVIKEYFQFGTAESLIVKDLSVKSGTVLYVSVIAMDHAGLQKRITSEAMVVDVTPPIPGGVEIISLAQTKWTGDDVLRVDILDFIDEESSIDYYTIFIGSYAYSMDIVQEIQGTDEMVEVNLGGLDLKDGHVYFLGVKAVNRAGLSSDYSVKEFGIDRSAPTGGHVLDGMPENEKDVDFQTDVHCIWGHWKGFTDPHSDIAYYRVGLGTTPLTDDIEPLINVGLGRDVMWNSSFATGETYFITVEACNGAGLCHSMSSDGVLLDDSPPIPGLVKVGSNSEHQTYISSSLFVEVFWTPFEDPQSGMDHYEICLGTIAEECDVMPMINSHLELNHIVSGVSMPINEQLYVTVTGYNNNLQKVSKTSNYFMVDSIPPVIVSRPAFVTNSTRFNNVLAQWDKSIIKTTWQFSDSESPIVRHMFTLFTHHEGHTPVERVELGYITEYTISLDDKHLLHNGDTYKAIVTACNAAGLCTSSESDDLLIDATPPHVGGFKEDMKWQNYYDNDNKSVSIVNLLWYGFYDHESGIKQFHIGVGTTYTGNELSDGLVITDAKVGVHEYNESLILNGPIFSDDKIVVSVLAENHAGLISPIARVTLLALSSSNNQQVETATGMFEIEKHSCDIHFCSKECTCAVVGRVCTEVKTNMTCNGIVPNLDNQFNLSVQVYAGLPGKPHAITASTTCLSAHWYVDSGVSNVQRFEWTAGIKDQPHGEGIFDLVNENPWIDVGKFQYGTYCSMLDHGTEYIVYVKAWVEVDTYLIFQSEPVITDHTPPAVRKGKFVKDSDSSCMNDYDVIDWIDNIHACWTGVFSDSHSSVNNYIVGLGTKPGVDNVVSNRNVEQNTTFWAANVSLSPGHQYYFTITAYNAAGLYRTLTSDGFVVDVDKPVAGVVYNTMRYTNDAVQSAADTFELSWRGFLDHDSGIKAYYIAIYEDSVDQDIIKDFINVNLQTSIKITNLNLEHSKKYYAAVKAIDAVGHASDIVASKSKLVDTTAPSAYNCSSIDNLYGIQEDTFSSTVIDFPVSLERNGLYIIAGRYGTMNQHPSVKLMVATKLGSYLPVLRSHDDSVMFHATLFSQFEGSYNVTVDIGILPVFNVDISLGKCEYSLTEGITEALVVTQLSHNYFKATIKVIDPESAVKQALLGVGTTPTGQQLKAFYPIDISIDEVFTVSAAHGTPLYATVVVKNHAGLQSVIRSEKLVIDHTPPGIENIHVQVIQGTDVAGNDSLAEDEILVKLNISWNAVDDESGIKMCFVSVGSLGYLNDIQKPQQATYENYHLTEDLRVSHGNRLYANIKCINNIELKTVQVAPPIVISTQKPNIDNAKLTFVPMSTYSMVHNQQGIQSNQSQLAMFWDGFTDETDITHYEYQLLFNNESIVDWTTTGRKQFVSLDHLTLVDGQSYTAQVRCVNTGSVQSDVISKDVFVESREPQLTGRPIEVTNDGNGVSFDCNNVFESNTKVDVFYDVMVGSAQGFADILDRHSLSVCSVKFQVPTSTIISADIKELFINIQSVYSTGMSHIYRTSYKLP